MLVQIPTQSIDGPFFSRCSEVLAVNKQNNNQSNAKRGYTIIELIVTIAVLLIASWILIPYATMGDASAGQSASRMAVSHMLTAQMDAITEQGYRRVYFYPDGSGWCVEIMEQGNLAAPFDANAANFAELKTESQGQDGYAIMNFTTDRRFQDISIDNVSFDGGSESVIFDPAGGIVASDGSPSTGGSFTLHSGDHSWDIVLSPLTGKISVQSSGGAH